MGDFAQELKLAREALGHKSAKAFFLWLKKSGVSFNYSYYMRLEQGGLPSEGLVKELAQALKGEWEDRLVLAYCRALFPKKSYLFGANNAGPAKTAVPAARPDADRAPKTGQKELTLKQVAALTQTETGYHIFLLSTLARKPIPIDELRQWFSVKALEAGLKSLISVELIRESPEGIEAIALEAKFPDAYNEELKASYEKFDKWDESFGAQLGLEAMINKMQIRRVSGRYINIIRKQLDVLFELVRSSDEMDARYNDKILQLKVVLRQGNLPG
jgi:hypothetical protein